MDNYKRSLLTALCLTLAACGGGGGGADSRPSSLALTKGNVISLNGQSADVAGVFISVPATGIGTMSDTSGAFDLGGLPPEIIDLVVTPPTGAAPLRTAMTMPFTVSIDLRGVSEATVHLSVSDDQAPGVSIERCAGGGGSDNDTRVAMTVVEVGLEGRIRVRRRDDGHTGFDVEASNLTPGRTVKFTITNPATTAIQDLGTVAADAFGEAEVELRTNDGDVLPFGVATADLLEDFPVAVRDGSTDLLLLEGTVPALGGLPDCTGGGGGGNTGRRTGESRLAAGAGVLGVAEVELRSRPARGEERIEVELAGTNVSGTIEVWLEDPSSPGTLALIGLLAPSGAVLEFELDTEQGEALPFGVTKAEDLSGLRIELKRQSDGVTVYLGVTPPMNPS